MTFAQVPPSTYTVPTWAVLLMAIIAIVPACLAAYATITTVRRNYQQAKLLQKDTARNQAAALKSEEAARASAAAAEATARSMADKDDIIDQLQEETIRLRGVIEQHDRNEEQLRAATRHCEETCADFLRENNELKIEIGRLQSRLATLEGRS